MRDSSLKNFPTGPLAILPVHNSKINQSSIVWTIDTILANDQVFKENFKEEFKKKYDNFFGKLIDWKKLDDLIPKNFKHSSKYKKTGQAGIFAGL